MTFICLMGNRPQKRKNYVIGILYEIEIESMFKSLSIPRCVHSRSNREIVLPTYTRVPVSLDGVRRLRNGSLFSHCNNGVSAKLRMGICGKRRCNLRPESNSYLAMSRSAN